MAGRLTLVVIAALGLAACGTAPPDTGDLAQQLCDPDSMRLNDVRQAGDQVTGRVNARTPEGGYAGPVIFNADLRTGRATLASSHWRGACPDESAEVLRRYGF